MESEDDLLNLLLKSPNSESIKTIAEQLEVDHNFSFSKDRNDLKGVWELRWSSSNSPFLKYSPFIDNLQILDHFNLNGLYLLKPKGIKSIIGTGILIRLYYINEKKIGVKFTHAGLLGPKFGKKNINDLDFVYDINPLELVDILKTNELEFISSYINFGVIIIKLNNKEYTLTSLREDFKQDGRYTEVRYVKSIKKDCLRRDLTFNALYMDSSQKVYDFYNGLEHLENSKIIFIGDFKKKCLEDNLRIIRFIRFCSLFK